MSRMRELVAYAPFSATDQWDTPQEGDEEMPEIVSRDHAGATLKLIEDYFRMREPASPITILLFKARNMLSKDFNAIVRELLPPG
jgi:type VI secretion system protein ImpA